MQPDFTSHQQENKLSGLYADTKVHVALDAVNPWADPTAQGGVFPSASAEDASQGVDATTQIATDESPSQGASGTARTRSMGLWEKIPEALQQMSALLSGASTRLVQPSPPTDSVEGSLDVRANTAASPKPFQPSAFSAPFLSLVTSRGAPFPGRLADTPLVPPSGWVPPGSMFRALETGSVERDVLDLGPLPRAEAEHLPSTEDAKRGVRATTQITTDVLPSQGASSASATESVEGDVDPSANATAPPQPSKEEAPLGGAEPPGSSGTRSSRQQLNANHSVDDTVSPQASAPFRESSPPTFGKKQRDIMGMPPSGHTTPDSELGTTFPSIPPPPRTRKGMLPFGHTTPGRTMPDSELGTTFPSIPPPSRTRKGMLPFGHTTPGHTMPDSELGTTSTSPTRLEKALGNDHSIEGFRDDTDSTYSLPAVNPANSVQEGGLRNNARGSPGFASQLVTVADQAANSTVLTSSNIYHRGKDALTHHLGKTTSSDQAPIPRLSSTSRTGKFTASGEESDPADRKKGRARFAMPGPAGAEHATTKEGSDNQGYPAAEQGGMADSDRNDPPQEAGNQALQEFNRWSCSGEFFINPDPAGRHIGFEEAFTEARKHDRRYILSKSPKEIQDAFIGVSRHVITGNTLSDIATAVRSDELPPWIAGLHSYEDKRWEYEAEDKSFANSELYPRVPLEQAIAKSKKKGHTIESSVVQHAFALRDREAQLSYDDNDQHYYKAMIITDDTLTSMARRSLPDIPEEESGRCLSVQKGDALHTKIWKIMGSAPNTLFLRPLNETTISIENVRQKRLHLLKSGEHGAVFEEAAERLSDGKQAVKNPSWEVNNQDINPPSNTIMASVKRAFSATGELIGTSSPLFKRMGRFVTGEDSTRAADQQDATDSDQNQSNSPQNVESDASLPERAPGQNLCDYLTNTIERIITESLDSTVTSTLAPSQRFAKGIKKAAKDQITPGTIVENSLLGLVCAFPPVSAILDINKYNTAQIKTGVDYFIDSGIKNMRGEVPIREALTKANERRHDFLMREIKKLEDQYQAAGKPGIVDFDQQKQLLSSYNEDIFAWIEVLTGREGKYHGTVQRIIAGLKQSSLAVFTIPELSSSPHSITEEQAVRMDKILRRYPQHKPMLRQLFKGTLENLNGNTGCQNFYFYGAPGTGKSNLATDLGETVNMPVFPVSLDGDASPETIAPQSVKLFSCPPATLSSMFGPAMAAHAVNPKGVIVDFSEAENYFNKDFYEHTQFGPPWYNIMDP
jgi:hypothetical protein